MYGDRSAWVYAVGDSGRERRKRGGGTDSDLKIYHLLCKSAHLVVEAESVFSSLFGGKDGI